MPRRLLSAASLSLLLMVSGCATMFTPRTQSVPVTSTPEGAEVFVDGEYVGTTPLIVSVQANEDHEVLVRLGEVERAWILEAQMSSSGSVGLTGDILILLPAGLLGVGILFCQGDCGVGRSEQVPIGVVLSALAITPLAVDVSTNQFYELIPGEIETVF